jgi:sugar/nucleoside kinase (ribokinase family)
MTTFFSQEQQERPIDVTSIENALVDLLVRAEDTDLKELGLHKGHMQLVDAGQQVHILANLGKLTTEVELGGSAANALRGMAMLGAKTSYSSAVGADTYGRAFSARLEELSILNELAVVAGSTGTCLVVVTPDGERTLNTCLGACREYRKEHVPLAHIQKSKMFFTTGYVWDTPNQIESIEMAIREAQKANVKIALDVADPFVVARSGETLHRLLSTSVHLVFANAEEANMLVGCKGEAAAKILSEKVEIAVVKDGGNGAYIGHKGRIIHIPTEKVTVVDTTGAGDMFAGGFMYGLCRGLSLEISGRIATLLAADTITHMGVRLTADIPKKVRSLIAV